MTSISLEIHIEGLFFFFFLVRLSPEFGSIVIKIGKMNWFKSHIVRSTVVAFAFCCIINDFSICRIYET